jgi:sulfite reductase alpha subunit-like flavoprotein
VVENREIRLSTDDGQTRHLELDISKSSLKYNYADNLGIFARNCPNLAAKMAKRLGLHQETLFSLRGAEGQYTKLPYPSVCSVQDALWFYCDFTAIPRLNVVKIFANYATDIKEKAKLLRYCDEDKQVHAYMYPCTTRV